MKEEGLICERGEGSDRSYSAVLVWQHLNLLIVNDYLIGNYLND